MTLEEMRALLAGTAADQADLVDCMESIAEDFAEAADALRSGRRYDAGQRLKNGHAMAVALMEWWGE